MQYKSVMDKLRKQCKLKNNTKFEMKLGVSFGDLPGYDAKYHLKCFKTYMRDRKSDQTTTMHQC